MHYEHHAKAARSRQGKARRNISWVRFGPGQFLQNLEPSRVTGGLVTFRAGRTKQLHTHPHGQMLTVISGVGWTQCWCEPKQEIRPGDVV
jgi:quercetin dioxygenase-like cupin family protein